MISAAMVRAAISEQRSASSDQRSAISLRFDRPQVYTLGNISEDSWQLWQMTEEKTFVCVRLSAKTALDFLSVLV